MIKFEKPIYVTQPVLPSIDEFAEYLKKIWDNKILTNNGPFHNEFEAALADYLGVKYVSVFANGTLALMIALQVLKIEGEVITTPFSFVATTHALWWNKIDPVFADVDPNYYNLDPDKVELAITPKTTAIIPVHVYGNPCDVKRFDEISQKYGLKIIYDAAHAFGVKLNGIPLVQYGDLSVLSFHATKVFNTIEGGAIICHDEKTKKRIDYLKNFGIVDEVTVIEPGINAKMNELQAAFGLLQLKSIDENIKKRKIVAEYYHKLLEGIPGINTLKILEGINHSYNYFPVIINPDEYGKTRDQLYLELKNYNVYGRRYFYPLISQFPWYNKFPSSDKENLKIAHEIAENILCLPLYPSIDFKTVEAICEMIRLLAGVKSPLKEIFYQEK
jgi:dTDP-4-amino-4,6-dideoxygalactose transaminase